MKAVPDLIKRPLFFLVSCLYLVFELQNLVVNERENHHGTNLERFALFVLRLIQLLLPPPIKYALRQTV